MRFFATLLACALVMGACSQSGIEPAADVTGGTRAAQDKVIVFHKVVLEDGVEVPAEAGQFKFELWGLKKNGKGEAELLGTFETDENGDVVVDFSNDLKGQGRGKYYFTEVFDDPEEAEKWEDLGDLPLTILANWGAVWDEYGEFAFGPEGPTIVNIPIVEDETELKKVGRVNLTNDADEVLKVNGDHPTFCYAILNREILEDGGVIELDMVGENANHTDLGDAYVSVVDGKIVITVEGEVREFEWMIYEGEWDNNGKKELTSEPLDFPEGDEDVCIFVRAVYWK